MAVSDCLRIYEVQVFIYLQLIIFLPFALIRDIAKLSTAALIADVFIFAGLVYIFGSEILLVAKRGMGEIKMFNPTDFPLFIGSVLRYSYHLRSWSLTVSSTLGLPYSLLRVLGLLFRLRMP